MSYAAAVRDHYLQQTGSHVSGLGTVRTDSGSEPSDWDELWYEVFRTQAIKSLPQNSMPMAMSFAVEALPIAEMEMVSSTTKLLAAIEKLFGNSATELARMLRVTRQMVYHYRQGMEPSIENKRRLKSLATLASECGNPAARPLKKELKSQQPGGRTLMEYLSEEDLDITALRRMLSQRMMTSDRAIRNKLANALSREESALARGDVTRARHAEGRPVYIGDPNAPGKLIQIRPDGSRTRGRMINRQFVPDGE